MSGESNDEKDRWLPEGVEAVEDLEEADAGPGDEDDDEDDDLAESYGAELEAPWSPVPVQAARQFLKEHPEAKLDLVFPESYAEDRSAKLKDLATAQGLSYFTHQRTATQAAQEFGFEQYDYDAEMQQIRLEKKKYGDILGAGDELAARVAGVGPGAGGGPTIGAPVPGLAGEDDLDREPRRADLAGPEQAKFRRLQRQATRTMKVLSRGLRDLAESSASAPAMAMGVAALLQKFEEAATALRDLAAKAAQPPVVNVQPPQVTITPPEVVIEPVVQVERPPRRVVVERDERGLIKRLVETEEPA